MGILRSCHIVVTVTVLNIYGDSIPVVIPPTSPRIAVNSRLNLLYRLQDAVGPSQLPSWINASASLETKDNSVKASFKVTTSQNQTDLTLLDKPSTEILLYHAKVTNLTAIFRLLL